ncbi:hypothetical protein HYFRA_00009996 [Hymenoscyphus fraxineus]|uniref:Uncharacterized protein n=1 Tax=Hymenoscyphus fraxineus TaxID=746836 RepID=A0A9N9KVA6_9HELO|nr:hypothetical protein HYFRA_00009996 [Hymenoscyphus fraxineus]
MAAATTSHDIIRIFFFRRSCASLHLAGCDRPQSVQRQSLDTSLLGSSSRACNANATSGFSRVEKDEIRRVTEGSVESVEHEKLYCSIAFVRPSHGTSPERHMLCCCSSEHRTRVFVSFSENDDR